MDRKSHLLFMLKTLADEKRLMMVGLMNGQERTGGEIAGLLNLSEATVSHHIKLLHGAGFLHLRMAGNQHFYRISETGLERFKAYAGELEIIANEQPQPKPDDAWIEALDWNEADKKILRDYTAGGRLTQIPMKDKKWAVILRWLATHFEPGVRYTEKQVNGILTQFDDDYASMRRGLVEFGFMRRERGGSTYWLTPEDEG